MADKPVYAPPTSPPPNYATQQPQQQQVQAYVIAQYQISHQQHDNTDPYGQQAGLYHPNNNANHQTEPRAPDATYGGGAGYANDNTQQYGYPPSGFYGGGPPPMQGFYAPPGGGPPGQGSWPPQQQQGYYGQPPPQGMYYQQQPMYGQQPQYGYYAGDRGRGGSDGVCAGILAALTCCCCLDLLLF